MSRRRRRTVGLALARPRAIPTSRSRKRRRPSRRSTVRSDRRQRRPRCASPPWSSRTPAGPLSFRIPGYVIALKQTGGEGGRRRDIAEGDRVAGAPCSSASAPPSTRTRCGRRRRRPRPPRRLRQGGARLRPRHAPLRGRSLTKAGLRRRARPVRRHAHQLLAARAVTERGADRAGATPRSWRPFDGEIVEKAVELGAFVGPGAPVFVVARTELVKIVVGVPDTVLPAVKLGQPVDVSVDAFADRTFRARISRDRVGRRPGPELRGRGGDPQPGPRAESGHDRLARAGGGGRRAAGRLPGAAVSDRGRGRRQVRRLRRAGPEGAKVAPLRQVEIGPRGRNRDQRRAWAGRRRRGDHQRREPAQGRAARGDRASEREPRAGRQRQHRPVLHAQPADRLGGARGDPRSGARSAT